MRIGELARQAGVNIQTIRFYERKKLLRKPPRSTSGYRVYSPQDLEIVRTIRQLKHFGFTLREARRVLSLYALPDEKTGRTPYAHGSHACLEEVVKMGLEKLKVLDDKIRSLSAVRAELAAALQQARKRVRSASNLRRRSA
jgi:DNA-binding transcriptional MerR regulator